MSLNLKLPELAVNVQEPEPTEQDIEDVKMREAQAIVDAQVAKNKDVLALTDLKKKAVSASNLVDVALVWCALSSHDYLFS